MPQGLRLTSRYTLELHSSILHLETPQLPQPEGTAASKVLILWRTLWFWQYWIKVILTILPKVQLNQKLKTKY